MGEGDENNEIMTLSEVAEYLQLAERTVLRMAQRGEIPAGKVASQWRFVRPLVREWVVGQMQGFASSEPSPSGDHRHQLLPMTEVLHPELMSFDLSPAPKESILRQLLTPLLETGFAKDTNRLLQGLLDRERMMTTAIGHRIAIPHPRIPISNMFPEPAVALGICADGTDFQAVDDQLVHLFFLVCATRVETHLQLMAAVAWFARQPAIPRIESAKSSHEVMGIVKELLEGSGRGVCD